MSASAGVAVGREEVLERLGEEPESSAGAVIERLEASGLTLIDADRLERLLRRLAEATRPRETKAAREGDT